MPLLRKRKRPRPTSHPTRGRAPGLHIMDILDPPRAPHLRPGPHHPLPQPNPREKLPRSDLSGLRLRVGCGVSGVLFDRDMPIDK